VAQVCRSPESLPSPKGPGSTFLDGGKARFERGRVPHPFWMTRALARVGLSRATTGESLPILRSAPPNPRITDGAAQKCPNWRPRWSRSMAPIPLRLRRSAPPGRAGGAPAPCAADKCEVPVEVQDIAERSLVNPPPCLPSTRRLPTLNRSAGTRLGNAPRGRRRYRSLLLERLMARGCTGQQVAHGFREARYVGGHGAHLHKCPASSHGNYLPRLDSAHSPIEVKSSGEVT
jgi:hypothetical protein